MVEVGRPDADRWSTARPGRPGGTRCLRAGSATTWRWRACSSTMASGEVTALIGPSGCGKSTFLRLLNRMHELVPGSAMAGEILLDGEDIYGADMRAQVIRTRIGMVFQKPNPFPAMSVRENVLAGLKLTEDPLRRPRCSGRTVAAARQACGGRYAIDSDSPGGRAVRVASSSGFASRGRWPSRRTCC